MFSKYLKLTAMCGIILAIGCGAPRLYERL